MMALAPLASLARALRHRWSEKSRDRIDRAKRVRRACTDDFVCFISQIRTSAQSSDWHCNHTSRRGQLLYRNCGGSHGRAGRKAIINQDDCITVDRRKLASFPILPLPSFQLLFFFGGSFAECVLGIGKSIEHLGIQDSDSAGSNRSHLTGAQELRAFGRQTHQIAGPMSSRSRIPLELRPAQCRER